MIESLRFSYYVRLGMHAGEVVSWLLEEQEAVFTKDEAVRFRVRNVRLARNPRFGWIKGHLSVAAVQVKEPLKRGVTGLAAENSKQ
jgi:DNA-directed RNA polymerase subunit E'/Rpb7